MSATKSDIKASNGMKLWARIALTIAVMAVIMSVSSQIFFFSYLESALRKEDERWSVSLAQVLAQAVTEEALHGDIDRVSSLLRKITADNEELLYLFVMDEHSRILASATEMDHDSQSAQPFHACKKQKIKEVIYEGKQATDICNALGDGVNAHVHVGISEEDLMASVEEKQHEIRSIVTLASILAVILVALIVRRATSPLSRLTDAVRSYGRSETFEKVSKEGAAVDVSVLIDSFEEMVEQRAKDERELKDYRDNLENLVSERTEALEKLIQEHKETAQRLVEAKVEAEHANSAKSAFISQMSHELRTPMNAILGFSQILEMDFKDDPLASDNIKEIRNAGDHLLELINEILDLSRIESGRMEINIETVSWSEIVNECIKLTQSQAEKYNIEVAFLMVDSEADVVLGDRLRLKQVTLNLLSNAIKYNRRRGRVNIELDMSDEGRPELSVEDTGEGISEEDKLHMFEPFNRLGYTNSEIEGAGIGLFICRRMLGGMDGTLDFESELGVGSRFFVTMPRGNAVNIQRNAKRSNEGAENFDADASAGKRVLYVEDEPVNAKLVSRIFSGFHGVVLMVAFNSAEAVEYLKSGCPDLILLDINLPDMSGFDLRQKLITEYGCENVPIIAVSANATDEYIIRAKNEGFDEYIAKPFDVAEFSSIIKAKLNS